MSITPLLIVVIIGLSLSVLHFLSEILKEKAKTAHTHTSSFIEIEEHNNKTDSGMDLTEEDEDHTMDDVEEEKDDEDSEDESEEDDMGNFEHVNALNDDIIDDSNSFDDMSDPYQNPGQDLVVDEIYHGQDKGLDLANPSQHDPFNNGM